jgi:predicted ATP-dependent serine protease
MKVGKSTFAYPLALAVMKGQLFLGTPTLQGPVLILAVEEHARDVRLRLERFGATPADPLHVHSGRLDPASLPVIRNFVKEHGVRLVLLDTLSRYWRIHDENDNAEIIRLVSPFVDLAHETDAAVVLVHHERKSGGADGHGIRGGSALFGLVDQSLSLERRPGGGENQRVLKALGRYDDSPAELVLELDGDEYRAIGTPEQFTLAARQAVVLGILTDVPQTVEALMAAAQLPRTTTQKVLSSLGAKVARQGAGIKGDPYLYCRPAPQAQGEELAAEEPDSIPPDPLSVGAETNPPCGETEAEEVAA